MMCVIKTGDTLHTFLVCQKIIFCKDHTTQFENKFMSLREMMYVSNLTENCKFLDKFPYLKRSDTFEHSDSIRGFRSCR